MPISSNRWNSSTVSSALGAVFQGELKDKSPFVIPYGVNDEGLWRLEDAWFAEQLGKPDSNGIVLVWDSETPLYAYSGNISTAEYLNPLTWGLWACRKFPSARVMIIDSNPAEHSAGRFYQGMSAIAASQLPFRLITDTNEILNAWGAYRPPSSRGGSDLLVQTLRAMLTERGHESSHHALANIVGPLVLMGDDSAGPHGALKLLFREFGLIPSLPVLEPREQATPGSQPNFPNGPTRILLVDDQAEQGWARWVERMVKPEGQCSVEVREDPYCLLEAVERWSGAERRSLDFRFHLGFPPSPMSPDAGSEHVSETILLLDLRLFSLVRPELEAQFVKRLIPLCRLFQEGGAKPCKWAWPGFSDRELIAAEKWCEGPTRETDAYLGVLTLLPRLLALVDLSIPIVIFSSTGQRRIIEILKPYGNIITDFEKPRFTGLENADLVLETEARFREAISKADRILNARRRCRDFSQTTILDSAFKSAATPPPQGDGSAALYLELFLDERDWDRKHRSFDVGGCFAAFAGATLTEAQAKADEFDNWLVQRGLRFFHNRGVGLSPGALAQKGGDLGPILKLLANCPTTPKHLGLVRMRVPKQEGYSDDLLFDPVHADNRNHLALRAILELFLAESVPALAGNLAPENVSVSLFPGTRVVEILNRPNLDYQNVAMRRFGLKRLTGNLFFSMGRDQVYPLVAEILDSRAIRRNTERVLAVQLPYSNGHFRLPEWFRCQRCGAVWFSSAKEERNPAVPATLSPGDCCRQPKWQPDYRALHYLADEVLTEFPDGANHRYDAWFAQKLVPGEFDETRDDFLLSELAAGRCLDTGDIVGAVCCFPHPNLKQGRGKPRAGFWLQKRIGAGLLELSGGQFLQISNRIRVRD